MSDPFDVLDSAAAYDAERRDRHRKAIKLVEALASPHEDVLDGDHEWRRCRSCHARNELDFRAARDLLGLVVEVMQERAAIQADFADWLADREGNLYEQVKDLVELFDVERETHAELVSAVSAAIDSTGTCFDGLTDGVQCIAARLNLMELRWSKLLDALGSEWDDSRCRVCGKRVARASVGSLSAGHVHHVTHRSQGGGHDPANMVLLCARCHADAHSHRLKLL